MASAERSGQLAIAGWEDAYLKDSYFDESRQLQLIEEILRAGRREGYPLTRLIANIEYESRLNYVLPNYADIVICAYDLSRFSTAIVMDILRTHPVVILGWIPSRQCGVRHAGRIPRGVGPAAR